MESMKSKVKEMFSLPRNRSCDGGRVGMNVEEWEIRPGGMLVQKRNSDPNQTTVSIPIIKVRVKHGSTYHEICISSIASFGELKKMLAERTGLHPEDQKLMYKKKERDSKMYLDVVGVKDGSKMVVVEDIESKERRCLEKLRNAKIEKAKKSMAQINLQVDKFAEQVAVLEATASRGEKVTEKELDNLIGMLMTELVKLDEIAVDGDMKLQKRMQERRVQKHIETLDKLKPSHSKLSSKAGKIPLQPQEYSIGKILKPLQKQQGQSKQKNVTEQRSVQKQKSRHSPVVVTTKWETFE